MKNNGQARKLKYKILKTAIGDTSVQGLIKTKWGFL